MSKESPISSETLISEYMNLLRRSPAAPEIAIPFLSDALPVRAPRRSCALLLSPHPDDECLTGALPLRLSREQRWQIVNLAVTLGSYAERREERKAELAKACAVLGFDCALPQPNGFENVTTDARSGDAPAWQEKVACLAEIIAHYEPQAVFLPHAQDAHPAHIGTHLLGMDALAQQAPDFSCAVIQTEYWHPLADPNLMIGVGEKDAATLLSALACHVGEVARNPYDARFPAFLIDNVRRGSERVGGKGAASAAADFAMLYKLGIWKNGKFVPSALKRAKGADESVGDLVSPR